MNIHMQFAPIKQNMPTSLYINLHYMFDNDEIRCPQKIIM